MASYIVIKPTTIMPEATGPSYGEGDSFDIDERESGRKEYITELGDVVAKKGSREHKAWEVLNAQKEAALEAEALAAKGLEPEEEPEPEPEEEPNEDEGV